MVAVRLLLLGVVLLLAASSEAATYYVDDDAPGGRSCATAASASTPRNTINSGIACMSGGDELVVKPGTYPEILSVLNGVGGYTNSIPNGLGPNARTVIRAETAGTVVINPPALEGFGIATHFDESQYITLRGVVIDGQFDPGMTFLVSVGGTSYFRAQELEIKNGPGMGIQGSCNNSEFLDLHIHDIAQLNGESLCGDDACTPAQEGVHACAYQFCHAIYLGGGSYQNTIDGGYYHEIDAFALQIYGSNNIVRNAKFARNTKGIGSFGSNALIYNNVLWDNEIHITNMRPGRVAHNTLYGFIERGWSEGGDSPPQGMEVADTTEVQNNLVMAMQSGQPAFAVYRNPGTPEAEQVPPGSLFSGNVCTQSGQQGCSIIPASPSPVVNAAGENFHVAAGAAIIGRSPSQGSPFAFDHDGLARPTSGSVDTGAYVFAEGGPPVVSLTATPSSVQAGSAVTAEWRDIESPTAQDTVRLYAAGAPETSSLAQVSTGNTVAGTAQLTVPSGTTPGTYELRLFSGSGVGTRLALSNTFSVTAEPVPGQTEWFMATNGDNAANCTELTPCQTFASILPRLQAGQGHTLTLRAGTYTAATTRIHTSAAAIPSGANWQTPTTIRAYPGETVTLAPTGGGAIIWIDSPTSFVVFDRLHLDVDGTAVDSSGYYLATSAQDLRIANGSITGPRYEAVVLDGADRIEVRNMTLQGSVASVAVYIQGATSGVVLDGNLIQTNAFGGVYALSGPLTNLRVLGNTFTGNAGGPAVAAGDGTAHLWNNLLVGNTAGAVQFGPGSLNSTAYHNTIMDNTGVGIQLDAAGVAPNPTTPATGTILINNIVFGNTAGITNNGTGTTGTPNLTTDPGVVGGGNYALASDASAAHETGATLAAVTIDIDGRQRPQGSFWDIGAYERIPTGLGEQPIAHSSAGMLLGRP